MAAAGMAPIGAFGEKFAWTTPTGMGSPIEPS